jgi:hypothetical protein
VWAQTGPRELAGVRYVEYSYWNELSRGSRLAADATRRIDADLRPWGVANERFRQLARALLSGSRFPPLILAGRHYDDLVCLEGNLRLTAHALAGFPTEAQFLVGTAPELKRWAQRMRRSKPRYAFSVDARARGRPPPQSRTTGSLDDVRHQARDSRSRPDTATSSGLVSASAECENDQRTPERRSQ